MHEAGIAQMLLDQALATAATHGLVRVERIDVEIGEQRMVEFAALRQAFELAAEGTVAAGAELGLTEIGLRAKCRACGHAYAATLKDLRCPTCTRAEPTIVAGNDIVITGITGDDGKD